MSEIPEVQPAPTENMPEPAIAGRFAIYTLPHGQALLVADSEATGPVRLPIPKFVLAQALRKNPEFARVLFGDRKSVV